MQTTIQLLTNLCRRSELLWDAAVDTSPRRTDRAATDRAEALECWDAALAALRVGDLERASDMLDGARTLARAWGDDAPEREALEALRAFTDGLDEQIEALSGDAAAARDDDQVELCRRALSGDEAARTRCVRALLNAEAASVSRSA